jgi:hypothetical protein
MNGNQLRIHALDEMHHRLRQVRSYSLVDEDGSKIQFARKQAYSHRFPANAMTR